MPYGGGKQLSVFGSCWLQIEWKGSILYVVKGSYEALLGYKTCLNFGLFNSFISCPRLLINLMTCLLALENSRTEWSAFMLMKL